MPRCVRVCSLYFTVFDYFRLICVSSVPSHTFDYHGYYRVYIRDIFLLIVGGFVFVLTQVIKSISVYLSNHYDVKVSTKVVFFSVTYIVLKKIF